MKALMGFFNVLSIPLMFLNFLGGIVSGIWLVSLGEWRTVGLGILLFGVGIGLIRFALMPQLLIVALGIHFEEKGKTFGMVCFGALASFYTLSLITVWCCGMLFLFVKGATSISIIPLLIWSYCVATVPWHYLMQKEQGENFKGFMSFLATFLAELAYLVIILLVIFMPITLYGASKVFGGFMLVGVILQISAAMMINVERKKSKEQSSDPYK